MATNPCACGLDVALWLNDLFEAIRMVSMLAGVKDAGLLLQESEEALTQFEALVTGWDNNKCPTCGKYGHLAAQPLRHAEPYKDQPGTACYGAIVKIPKKVAPEGRNGRGGLLVAKADHRPQGPG